MKMRAFASLALFLLVMLAVHPAGAQKGGSDDSRIGLYVDRAGKEVYVDWLPDIQGLLMVDYPAGRIRPLRPEPDGSLSFGRLAGAPTPIVGTLRLNSPAPTISEGGDDRPLQRMRFRREEVKFQSGRLSLAGTLTLPPGPGPHPAVVLLHGSGPQDRNFVWLTSFFAHRGVAVLAYDKRGVGGSQGDWRAASLQDLAADALAAIETLRGQPNIDRRRIGLYGSSNGGWVAPLAASLAPRDRVAFVIARSPSALPERVNIIFEVQNALREAGFDERAVAQAARLHHLHLETLRSPSRRSWDAYRQAIQAAVKKPWFAAARLPAEVAPWSRATQRQLQADADYWRATEIDPPRLWARLDRPLLIQLGSSDRYIDSPKTVRLLRQATAGKPRAFVRYYQNGDHGLFESPGGFRRDIARVARFVPGYLSDLDKFIVEEIVGKDLVPGLDRASLAEIRSRYATLSEAFAKADVATTLAQRTADFTTVIPDGTRQNAFYMEQVLRRSFDSNRPPFVLRFTPRCGKLNRDGTVSLIIFQQFSRNQEIQGAVRRVDSDITQRETWRRTKAGWRLASVDKIHDPHRWIDGRQVDPTVPYHPNVAPFFPANVVHVPCADLLVD